MGSPPREEAGEIKPYYELMRLGARYERAIQARDFDRAIRPEHEIARLAARMDDRFWISTSVVAGRNFVRARRGQNGLNP